MPPNNGPKKKVTLPLHLRKEFAAADSVAALFDAIIHGRTGAVAVIFDRYPDAADWRHNNHTPLTQACMGQKGLDVLALLIERGCPLDQKDPNGWTPAGTAAFNNRVEKIVMLLEAGADIEARDGMGHTPLLRAVKAGHAECVDLLVICGADTEARNNFGENAADILRKNNDLKIAKIIDDAKARLGKSGPPALTRDIAAFEKPVQIRNRNKNKGLKQ